MDMIRFPNEPTVYRAARDELLSAEKDLRRRVEEVAAMRRRLPLGGPTPEDYVFEEGARDIGDGSPPLQVRLSQLFAKGKDTLVLYNFMFGAQMEHACPMCTCFLDGLDGNARHIEQRVNLAIVAKSPIERIRSYARTRGWRNLRLLSSASNSFNRDYRGDAEDGSQNSVIHTFVKREERVHHFYSSELSFAPAEANQHPRHIDLMWPVWNVFDITPEGRGKDWFPKRSYE